MSQEDVAEPLYIVFDGPSGHESGRFVEVENADGEGRSVGEWEQHGERSWRLGPVFSEAAIVALSNYKRLAESLGPLLTMELEAVTRLETENAKLKVQLQRNSKINHEHHKHLTGTALTDPDPEWEECPAPSCVADRRALGIEE